MDNNGSGGGNRTMGSGASGPGGSVVAGVTTVNGAAGSISTAVQPGLTQTVAAGVTTFGQVMDAEWTVGVTRVYAVDGINGNDTNRGFSDPASTSAADYVTASAAAGLVAKQTLAGLAAIFPRVGNGRTYEIQINGAVYTAGVGVSTAYAGALETFLGGLTGYAANCTVRGTGTNPTAGTVAFDGSAADCAYCGMNTATGMNAAGYNPTGSPTTTSIPCLKVGGAAPGFAAEPAIPVGARIRFDAATVTAALRNVARHISGVTGGTTLTVPTALPAVPAAGDTFYIEEGGWTVGASSLIHDSGGASATIGLNLVGLKLTGALTIRGGTYLFSGIRATSFSTVEMKGQTFSASYAHPVRGNIAQVGQFARSDGGFTNTLNRQQIDGVTVVGAYSSIDALLMGGTVASTFGGGVSLLGAIPQFGIQWGNSTTNTIRSRIIGPGTEAGLALSWWSGTINQLDITNMGAKPAIKLEGTCVLAINGMVGLIPSLGGSTGNTDVGLDLTLSRNSVIVLDVNNMPTLTGTVGDVRLSDGNGNAFAGGKIVSWASIVAGGVSGGGVIDAAGNTFIVNNVLGGGAQQSRRYTRSTEFTGKLTTGIGAVFTYCASSDAPTANQATPWVKPTRLRMARAIMVSVVNGAVGVPITISLYKSTGGAAVAATTMVCTVAAGAAVLSGASDFSHPQMFDLTDGYVVRADAAIDGVLPGNISFAGSIEWA